MRIKIRPRNTRGVIRTDFGARWPPLLNAWFVSSPHVALRAFFAARALDEAFDAAFAKAGYDINVT